jgi:hypothetical protein
MSCTGLSIRYFFTFLLALSICGCSSTELIESPKTAFVPESVEKKDPKIFWSSRNLNTPFDYLGQVKVRSWTYDGALDRLRDGAKDLRADALIDIQFQQIGFLNTMQAFAIKFK